MTEGSRDPRCEDFTPLAGPRVSDVRIASPARRSIAACEPLPEQAERALRETTEVDCDAFARLPWEGLWHRGPWILPANAASTILRLAENEDGELRWRAVQGLAASRESARHLTEALVVPVLIERLADRDSRVREAAALALAERGESVLELHPDVAAIFGRQFRASGFGIEVKDLPPGTYTVAVFPWSRTQGRFAPASTVLVIIP